MENRTLLGKKALMQGLGQASIRTVVSFLLKTALAAVFIVFAQGCAHQGPYKGRVIEEKNNQPIPGVVVVISWSYTSPNVGGGTTHCLDADEAVTDAEGEFEIHERRVGLFDKKGSARVHVYKVGYARVECMWNFIDSPGACFVDKGAAMEGDRAIIPLKRVAKDRLWKEGPPPHISCGRKNEAPLIEYIRVHDEYQRARGLKP
ncbi:MAG: carboxypeptidase regulatory-like domain-containing protein [Desulfobacterales bacterium]|nr:carboxypeptidase regulatory-like domain-containing protein [Desulfobacterales bacterium]